MTPLSESFRFRTHHCSWSSHTSTDKPLTVAGEKTPSSCGHWADRGSWWCGVQVAAATPLMLVHIANARSGKAAGESREAEEELYHADLRGRPPLAPLARAAAALAGEC